ncbi:MAG TPA: hypothetical protein VG733_03570 [Chthoniobacteraceae bacterium]|nr:hypothetical protein [Chthoniobacteraceae bacterium]
MRKIAALFLLLPLVFTGCDIVTPVSKRGDFKSLSGDPVITRKPMQLHELDYALNKYDDRYELDSGSQGMPLVGVIPKGHPVFFQKVLHRTGFNTDDIYLVGTLEFRGKTYPITYSPAGLDPEKYNYQSLRESLSYDFVVPK